MAENFESQFDGLTLVGYQNTIVSVNPVKGLEEQLSEEQYLLEKLATNEASVVNGFVEDVLADLWYEDLDDVQLKSMKARVKSRLTEVIRKVSYSLSQRLDILNNKNKSAYADASIRIESYDKEIQNTKTNIVATQQAIREEEAKLSVSIDKKYKSQIESFETIAKIRHTLGYNVNMSGDIYDISNNASGLLDYQAQAYGMLNLKTVLKSTSELGSMLVNAQLCSPAWLSPTVKECVKAIVNNGNTSDFPSVDLSGVINTTAADAESGDDCYDS